MKKLSIIVILALIISTVSFAQEAPTNIIDWNGQHYYALDLNNKTSVVFGMLLMSSIYVEAVNASGNAEAYDFIVNNFWHPLSVGEVMRSIDRFYFDNPRSTPLVWAYLNAIREYHNR